MVFLSGRESVQVLYHLFIYALLLEIQLSRGEVWDPVIKRGGLEIQLSGGGAGIQLSRGEGWDPVIKRGGLGSSYQGGKVGDPVIKRGGMEIQLSRGEG